MSKNSLGVIGIAFALGAFAAVAGFGSTAEPAYLGKWQGTDSSGQTAIVTFSEDGVFAMEVDGSEIYGGSGAAGTAKYAFDLTKNPPWLDIIVYDAAGQEVGRVLTIVKFTGPDTMLWLATSDPTVRPAGFDGSNKEYAVQLTRVH